MEAAKPLVQRHGLHAKIHGEVLVMQIVEVVVSHEPFFALGHKLMKSGMPKRRTDAGVHQMKDAMDGMRRNDPVDEHA